MPLITMHLSSFITMHLSSLITMPLSNLITMPLSSLITMPLITMPLSSQNTCTQKVLSRLTTLEATKSPTGEAVVTLFFTHVH